MEVGGINCQLWLYALDPGTRTKTIVIASGTLGVATAISKATKKNKRVALCRRQSSLATGWIYRSPFALAARDRD